MPEWIIPDCDCCEEPCICTCCEPDVFAGAGYWPHMRIKFSAVLNDVGTPTPSSTAYEDAEIDLYKVNGVCKWESADGIFRVRKFGSGSYGLYIYSAAADDDADYHSMSDPLENPPFGDADLWCRVSGNDDQSTEPSQITAGNITITDHWTGTVEWFQPITDDDWTACDDECPGCDPLSAPNECELEGVMMLMAAGAFVGPLTPDQLKKAKAATRRTRRRLPPCFDREHELRAGEIAALGLDTRCRWFACKTGEHPAHRLCPGKKPA